MTFHDADAFNRDRALELARQGDASAEALLAEGCDRLPDDAELAIAYAKLAQNRQDWISAASRWLHVRERFPDDPIGYIEGLACLISVGGSGEIEPLCAQGCERFPSVDRFAVELAWQAHHRRDWDAALLRWEQVRERFPAHITGYLGGAHTLMAAGRAEEADALLERALELQPNHREYLVAYARQAQQRGAMELALARWKEVRRRLPDDPIGYSGVANCLHDAGRGEEADKLIGAAVERFPSNQTLAVDYARMAQRRRDYAEAARRWDLVRQKFPNAIEAYVEACRALVDLGRNADAEALSEAAVTIFPNSFEIASLWAGAATWRQDWPEAERRWRRLRAQFPAEAECYLQEGRLMERSGRFDEAERAFQTGLERLPNHPELLAARARLAVRHDPAKAEQHWALFREQLPHDPRGYVEGARVSAELARFEESDALLDVALARFPNVVDVMFTWAHLAPRSKNSAEVLNRWQRFRERFSWHPGGYISGAWYLQELKRADEAEALLADAVVRFPGDVNVARAWAETAIRQGDVAVAVQRLQSAIEQHPSDLGLTNQLVGALIRLGRLDEAHRVLERARAQWPHDRTILRFSIDVAKESGDLNRAVSIWETAVNQRSIEDALKFELAKLLLSDKLPVDAIHRLLGFLGRERDTGERTWLPTVALMSHLIDHMPNLGKVARDFVNSAPANAFDPATLAVMKRDVGIDISEDETFALFEPFVVPGRSALTAYLFGETYWRLKPGRWDDIASSFKKFMDHKWQDSGWIRSGNETEILSLLTFSAVFQHSEYFRIVAEARRKLPVAQSPDLSSPAGVLARIAANSEPRANVSSPRNLFTARRLRIGVCISGQLRGYREAYPSWGSLGLDRHDTVRFVHVWKDVGRNWKRIWGFTALNPRLHGMLMGPDVIPFLRLRYPRLAAAVIAADADQRDLMDFYETDFVEIEDDKVDRFVLRPNVWKMHYKVEKAHKLARESGVEFDLMVRIRPDIRLIDNVAPDWHKIHETVKSSRLIYTDLPLRHVYDKLEVGDQFCVTSPELMDSYAGILNEFEQYAQSRKFPYGVPAELRSHEQLAMLTLYKGIVAKQLPALRNSMLLDPSMPSAREIAGLLAADLLAREADAFDREFVDVCEVAVAQAKSART